MMKRRLGFSHGGQENVPIKVICKHSGREKASIMRISAAAKELAHITATKHKFVGGRR